MKTYLADGLYMDYDGYQVRLWVERFGIVHEVFLDDQTLEIFLLKIKQIKENQNDNRNTL